MHGRGIWRLTRALTLAAAVAFATASVGPAIVGDVPVALADRNGNKDKNDDKNKENRKNVGNDSDEDHVLRGQVLEIDTLKDPPQLLMGTADGSSVVKVLKTDEIAVNGVRLGDHIEVSGEKVHELLFEATQISIDERYTGAPLDDDTKDKKDKKKN